MPGGVYGLKPKADKQERAYRARQSRIGVTHRFRNDWNLCFKLNRLTHTYHSSFSPCLRARDYFLPGHSTQLARLLSEDPLPGAWICVCYSVSLDFN